MIDRLIRRLLRRSWQRGVLDGSPSWMVVTGVAVIAYLGRRAMHRDAEVVFSEKLLAGESIRITHEARP